ncbi:hypothetical protein N5U20_06970 [Aliarcobacter butzleri]|uniref:hypothetical protein n=1 Tax=Aliarcobacter butzleri TaxID=28197 RepID=UPI0021B45BAB|nr:hypothetical protein [Aliarcobacter butzleri]MCT7612955.1 hypothetical protein [Aliarcobacter butzleri]MCT7641591.1 hypothetical protein [Aliarcobacter butzleri]
MPDKDVTTLKNSFKKLDNISLYEIVTIASVVGIFVNMLFSIEIIQNKNTAQYFLYTLIFGFSISILFVFILFFSMKIFNDTSKNEINISSQRKDRYFDYFLLNILVLLYLIVVSFIKSSYFSFNSSEIIFVNGIEIVVVFLYLFFTLAICSPIFIYEFELYNKMKTYDSRTLSNLE